MTKPAVARYDAGAVVIVPFPYSDRHAEKRRPALVVSTRTLLDSGFLWLLMITTARRGGQPQDVPIADLAGAGLPVPCVVRPTKIACVEVSRIVRQAGRLDRPGAERAFAAARAFIASPSSRGSRIQKATDP